MFERISSFPGLSLLVFLLLIIVAVDAHAQSKTTIYINGGYSTFQADELRAYNNAILQALPVEGRMVTDFPGFFSYSANLQVEKESLLLGAYLGHSSTGSRASYRDYSGYFRFDQLISTNSLGLEIGLPVAEKNEGAVNISLRYLLNFSNIAFKSESRVPEDIHYLHLRFVSLSHGLQPTVSITKDVKRLAGKLELGYELQLPGKLYLANDRDAYLLDERDRVVRYNGQGMRLQLGIGYRLL